MGPNKVKMFLIGIAVVILIVLAAPLIMTWLIIMIFGPS
jgi:hypothetical protein